jgi:hypothetical protein
MRLSRPSCDWPVWPNYIPHTATSHAKTSPSRKPTPTGPFLQRPTILLLQDSINDDHKIILMGDFNEELGSSTRGFTKLITERYLVDVYAATRGLEEEVLAYARGRKCLDYIVMTPSVASHVTRSGT